MKKGPDRARPEPRVLRGAKSYCLVCEASEDADGWLAEAEVDGWLAEAVVAGWLAEAVVAGWFAEAELAGWFAEAEVDGWLAEAEVDGWFAEAEADDAPVSSMPAICTPAALAWSMAACVRGPLMPSIGPGSKPLSLSACCSFFTDSSPCAFEPELMLLSAEAPLPVCDAPLVELEAIADGWFAEAEAAGWFAEAEAAGWLADAAGWFAEADAAGWFAEADVCLSLSVPPAITEPAAMRAATRASFLNSMVKVLSYGQLTAIRFGARGAPKFQRASAPGDARHSAVSRGACVT
jgi:hypothetical protein